MSGASGKEQSRRWATPLFDSNRSRRPRPRPANQLSRCQCAAAVWPVGSGAMLERHRYNALEIGIVERLVDISDCAKLKGLAGALGIGIPGHHNHSDGG